MRTPEVEIAISNTKAGMYCTDDADTLAAEVERLEKRLAHSHEVWRGEHDRAKAAERIECWQEALKGDPACRSKKADDLCAGCDCWKATRRNCS